MVINLTALVTVAALWEFTIMAGILLLNNKFSIMQLAGIPIVLFGVYLIHWEKFKQG